MAPDKPNGASGRNNFGVIVPRPDATALLLGAFPEFRERLDEEDLKLPHMVYGFFAQHLEGSPLGSDTWQRAWGFFNETAAREDSWLEEILQVSVFELFAANHDIAQHAKRNLQGRALKLFEAAQTYIEPGQL